MPTYTVNCANCGEQDLIAKMSEAETFMPCPQCGRNRPQVIGDFYHVEDRTHMWKGPLGNGYSTALGERMPESRASRDALAKKKGVEFVSEREFLASNKEAAEAVEYHKDVKAGARPEPWRAPDTSAFVEKPAWAKDLVK